jgi:hypothetical protein
MKNTLKTRSYYNIKRTLKRMFVFVAASAFEADHKNK